MQINETESSVPSPDVCYGHVEIAPAHIRECIRKKDETFRNCKSLKKKLGFFLIGLLLFRWKSKKMAAKLGRKGATNPKVFCGKHPKAIFVLFLFFF